MLPLVLSGLAFVALWLFVAWLFPRDTVKIVRRDTCTGCAGSGRKPRSRRLCTWCHGTGKSPNRYTVEARRFL